MNDPKTSGALLTKHDIISELKKYKEGVASGQETWSLSITREGEVISTDERTESNITHVGYDVSLCLGDRDRVFSLTKHEYLPIREGRKGVANKKYVIIRPRECVSVLTRENIGLGCDIAAIIQSKVRMVSKGISHISTTIDPNWQGELTLTFCNNSGRSIRLYEETPIATIVFFYCNTPVGRSEQTDVTINNNHDLWDRYSSMAATKKRKKRKIFIGMLVSTILAFGTLIYLSFIIAKNYLSRVAPDGFVQLLGEYGDVIGSIDSLISIALFLGGVALSVFGVIKVLKKAKNYYEGSDEVGN